MLTIAEVGTATVNSRQVRAVLFTSRYPLVVAWADQCGAPSDCPSPGTDCHLKQSCASASGSSQSTMFARQRREGQAAAFVFGTPLAIARQVSHRSCCWCMRIKASMLSSCSPALQGERQTAYRAGLGLSLITSQLVTDAGYMPLCAARGVAILVGFSLVRLLHAQPASLYQADKAP